MKSIITTAILAAGLLYSSMTAAISLIPPMEAKWSQAPDMTSGVPTLSMHRSFGPVVADDFQSDGRPITGLHWWGAYFQGTGEGADRDVSFEISVHQNCPAGSSDANCAVPNTAYATPKTNYFGSIVFAQEEFYGTTASGLAVYEYWLDLTGTTGPDFLGGTWNEVAGEIYWLDIAWDAGQLGTNPADDVWGWLGSAEQDLGFAVQTAPGGGSNPHVGPWNVLNTSMAFEVLTIPEPATLLLMGIGLAAFGYRGHRAR